MIFLDTNVLSALMRDPPDQAVVDWLDTQPAQSVWTTSISVFEVRFGVAQLPDSHRRRALDRAFELLLAEDLEGRVAAFDTGAAIAAADLAARRQASGRTIDFRDTQIAGIALSRRADIATRNRRHFEDLDVAVIDPWAAASPMQNE